MGYTAASSALKSITFISYTLLIISNIDTTFGRSVLNSKLKLHEIDLSQYAGRILGTPNETVGILVAQNGDINPEELGSYLEGDILLPRGKGRNGLKNKSYYWPNGVIPFEVAGEDFDDETLELFERVMKEYHDKTCIKFVPRDSQKNYISVESGCTGCWSYIGCLGQGKQVVNLQPFNCKGLEGYGCVGSMGTPIHEFMHAAGFEHEHNRFDRDNYIDVLWENIKPEDKDQFDKVSPKRYTTFGTTYDYTSVMHYSQNAFSKNLRRLNTMKAKKTFTGKMGQRDTFSQKDLQRIRKMYNCKTTTTATGYVLPPIHLTKQKKPQGAIS